MKARKKNQNDTPNRTNSKSPCKMVVGGRSFPFRKTYFHEEAVSFREGKSANHEFTSPNNLVFCLRFFFFGIFFGGGMMIVITSFFGVSLEVNSKMLK